MADFSDFNYSNKFNTAGAYNPAFGAAGQGIGGYGNVFSVNDSTFNMGGFGQFQSPFASSSSSFGNAPLGDLSKVKDVSSYVHNFFSSGNEDFMSSMLQFQMPSLYSGFGNSYGDIKLNYNSKYDKSQFAGMIKEKAQKYGVDPRLAMAVVQKESGFNPNATSKVGAMGLMQLMPGTARQMGVRNAYDPEQNVEGGIKYLAFLTKRYGGDTRKAVAAYNGGMGNIDRHGIDFCSETSNYHRKILG